MTPPEFIAKWAKVTLSERAASQEHFIDLCRLIGQPTPAEHDATGAEYTFDKGVKVTAPASKGSKGESGFADVWWRGKFGWEYKRKDKHKDLADAYRQLCQYSEDLENPPLRIVCDITTTEIHTNFTGTRPDVHTIKLGELDQPRNLDLLRRVFTDPPSFRPGLTREMVTKEVAKQVGELAVRLGQRGHDPHDAAHFLMKCMFCLFAEDVELLPERLFTRLLHQWRDNPAELTAVLTELFAKMATGGAFGTERIAFFNGGLFDEAPAVPLAEAEINLLHTAAAQDWSAVEPAIFGTLFERSLDPSKRAQIGAHYTSREDIMLVIEPVMMMPLRREWDAVRAEIDKQLARRVKATTKATKRKANADIAKALNDFMHRLGTVKVLDPACGSGNFLYVAIQELLYLEKEVIRHAARPEIGLGLLPTVRPTQLHGIEINPYAAELAQVVIWIGYLQWMRENGFNVRRDPILEPLQTIENRDAILDRSDPENPKPADWPEADFIIGNPPFLGCRLFRKFGLSEQYIEAVHAAYDLPGTSDMCCYWFELGRRELLRRKDVRVGLLATQGIRGRDSRAILRWIKETGDIFVAWSDREWILDGAAVHVSIIGFDAGGEDVPILDGRPVQCINADLTAGADTRGAARLPEMTDITFQGPVKVGSFEIPDLMARAMLAAPAGPAGRHNFEVLRPWRNGQSIVGRWSGFWIVDFALMSMDDAAMFPEPFEHVVEHVKPERQKNRRAVRRQKWWLWGEPNPNMRRLLTPLERYIATCQTAKHRLWIWLDQHEIAAQTVIGVARSDDYCFGILHSAIHELWALRQGTQLESRPRYTPTTCFETFPLPWPPGTEPVAAAKTWHGHLAHGSQGRPAPGQEKPDTQGQDGPDTHGQDARATTLHARISAAAAALNEQRERWLNPPEWIGPIAEQVDATDDFADVPPEARGLIRQSAIMALAAKDPNLKKRTLTNLYNQRPTWLELAHLELDRSVLAAYAAVDPDGQWSEDWAEVWQPTGAGQPLPEDHPLADARREIDQKVLENLLRMNLARAGEEL